LPAGLTALLVLLDAMPTHLPGFSAVMPLLPLICVFYWAIYRPDLLPPWVAFTLGIFNDIVAGTPLGVSSLVYLLIQGLTATQRRFFNGKSFLIAWWGFGLVGAGALWLQWLLVSMLCGHLIGMRAVLFEYFMTASFYPLLSWMLARTQLALLSRA
jgi:rod shape-determining protein MreD